MFLRVFYNLAINLHGLVPPALQSFPTVLTSPYLMPPFHYLDLRLAFQMMYALRFTSAVLISRKDCQIFWTPPKQSFPTGLTGILLWQVMVRAELGCCTRLPTVRRLDGKVHWLGHRDDIPNVLKSADVLVHASLWEGMPNAVLEAMAAGLAVIATSVEGSEELVIPGQTGWLVPPHDATALATALLEAAESTNRLKRYGQAGRLAPSSSFQSKRWSRATSRSGQVSLASSSKMPTVFGKTPDNCGYDCGFDVTVSRRPQFYSLPMVRATASDNRSAIEE